MSTMGASKTSCTVCHGSQIVSFGSDAYACIYCKPQSDHVQNVIAIRQILPSALNAEAIEFLRDNAVEILGEPKR